VVVKNKVNLNLKKPPYDPFKNAKNKFIKGQMILLEIKCNLVFEIAVPGQPKPQAMNQTQTLPPKAATASSSPSNPSSSLSMILPVLRPHRRAHS